VSEMEFLPLANLFPMLEAAQVGELVADIKAHGLRQAIVTYEGKILDGRNRYQACLAAGVEPRFKEYTGTDPLAYVVSLNLNRRHLDASQRATVAAKIATLGDGQRQVGKFADVATQKESAKLMNVSERSVRSARQVLERGTPELIASVEQGKKSISAAAKSLRPQPPPMPDFGRHITDTLATLTHDPVAEHMAQPSVRPADKYFAAQEAKLGPVASPTRKISPELTTALKGKKATLTMWMKQHADDGIPALMTAFAASIEIIERLVS
jgi:ParB-like chromosome segregation protein Spo0J